jgi:rhodanese-related sulfurtransferase
VVEQSLVDLGTIAMDKGNVSVNYVLTNKSSEPITIDKMYTSCMCTKAKITTGDEVSQLVGMKGHGGVYSILQVIEPGQQAIVEAIFDPNAHGPKGVGLARRTVFLETDSSEMPLIKLNFEANVVATSAEIPSPISYTDINAKELNQMLEQEDVFLVDVHIPEQEHIIGTDLFIPFDEISDNINQLPNDKDAKIVLYCRSGNMSIRASEDLVKAGYKNVYNLVGGKNAYDGVLNN